MHVGEEYLPECIHDTRARLQGRKSRGGHIWARGNGLPPGVPPHARSPYRAKSATPPPRRLGAENAAATTKGHPVGEPLHPGLPAALRVGRRESDGFSGRTNFAGSYVAANRAVHQVWAQEARYTFTRVRVNIRVPHRDRVLGGPKRQPPENRAYPKTVKP